MYGRIPCYLKSKFLLWPTTDLWGGKKYLNKIECVPLTLKCIMETWNTFSVNKQQRGEEEHETNFSNIEFAKFSLNLTLCVAN